MTRLRKCKINDCGEHENERVLTAECGEFQETASTAISEEKTA